MKFCVSKFQFKFCCFLLSLVKFFCIFCALRNETEIIANLSLAALRERDRKEIERQIETRNEIIMTIIRTCKRALCRSYLLMIDNIVNTLMGNINALHGGA